MSTPEQHREIVKKLLDSKAIDFTAIGKILGEVGPSLALSEIDDPDDPDWFCGTMRYFVHVVRGPLGPDPWVTTTEDLEDLGENASELQ